MALESLPTVGGSAATWGNELNTVLNEIRATLFASMVDPFRDNHYYDTRHFYGGSAGAFTLDAANRIYFVPFWVGPDGFAADRVAINVTTGAAGNCRLGAYTDNTTTGAPNALIADWGEVDVSTTGTKEITIDTLLPGVAPRFRVWLAVVGAVQPGLWTLNANNTGRFGSDIMPTSGNSRWGYYDPHTYGALPDPAATAGVGTNTPLIFLRKKAA